MMKAAFFHLLLSSGALLGEYDDLTREVDLEQVVPSISVSLEAAVSSRKCSSPPLFQGMGYTCADTCD